MEGVGVIRPMIRRECYINEYITRSRSLTVEHGGDGEGGYEGSTKTM